MCAVGRHRIGAEARGPVAGTGDVTLIDRGADDRIAAAADASPTGVGLSAQVTVVAQRAVGGRRIGAEARGRIAGANDVTSVRRRADNWLTANAQARFACIIRGAEIAVVAGRAVGGEGIGARSRCRVAGTGDVALIGCAADDGISADAGAG